MFRLCNIPLFFLLLALACPVQAQDAAPMVFRGIYDIRLGQIPFARVGMEIDQEAARYNAVADIIITGLLKMFTQHASHTTADGRGADFTYPQRTFESDYATKKKKRHILMRYRKAKEVDVMLTPPEPPDKRPPIAADIQKNSVDPLTFVMTLRQDAMRARREFLIPSPLEGEGQGGGSNHMQRARHTATTPPPTPSLKGRGNFSIHVFDGRRMHKANVEILGPRIIEHNGKKTNVFAASLTRELLGGFTASELKKARKNKEHPLIVYFSNDERFVPIRLEMDFWLGTISATLAKECRTGESCLFGIR